MSRITTTLSQKVKLVELVRLHCKRRDDKSFIYDPGYDDATIANMVSPALGHLHVARIRRELNMLVRPFKNAAEETANRNGGNSRLEKLEARVQELTRRYNALAVEFGLAIIE